jgi:hypothetical protein
MKIALIGEACIAEGAASLASNLRESHDPNWEAHLPFQNKVL